MVVGGAWFSSSSERVTDRDAEETVDLEKRRKKNAERRGLTSGAVRLQQKYTGKEKGKNGGRGGRGQKQHMQDVL